MKNLFNEDDFNALFESKESVIDSEGKGPKGNTKTPDVGATKGMQSDFDSMFSDLFSDAEMGDDQSAPVGKQDDTGAAGGSVDPQGDDKGNPPVKSEWDSLFETGETDSKGADEDDSIADSEIDKKKCNKKGKKLKSDFEALFEDDDEDDDETAGADPEAGTDPVPPSSDDDDDDKKKPSDEEFDEVAEESADMLFDMDEFEF